MKLQLYSSLFFAFGVPCTTAFIAPGKTFSGQRFISTRLYGVGNDDWRAFRAKLVQQEVAQSSTRHSEVSDDGQSGWAYEQSIVEPGSVLVQIPNEREIFGLQQQFMYKAVVLIMDQNPEVTVGLILNRPTDISVSEADGLTSRLMYGGDHSSIHGQSPQFYCLHSNESCSELSKQIVSGLYLTSMTEAREMVESNMASTGDFLLISGFVQWASCDIETEMANNDWRSLSIEPRKLLRSIDSRSSTKTWNCLLEMLRKNDAKQYDVDSFGERMLREWMRTYLVRSNASSSGCSGASDSIQGCRVKAGQLLRSSSQCHDFLFEKQEFHKSLVLVLQDDDHFSVAVILNHPTSNIEVETEQPIRRGGSFDQLDVDIEMPPFCIHTLGEPVGGEAIGESCLFFKTSIELALYAIERGVAEPNDFMVIKGWEIWHKEDGEDIMSDGLFEVVSTEQVKNVWQTLQMQEISTPLSMESNIDIALHAWRLSASDRIFEGVQDDDTTSMQILGMDAIKTWVATHILSDNTLRP